MGYMEAEVYASSQLQNRISKADLLNISPMLVELHENVGLSYMDISTICCKFPDILTFDVYQIVANLKSLAQNFDIKTNEFKFLVLKNPYVLCLDADYFLYKLKLIKTAFGYSTIDSIKLIYTYPTLLFINKEFIIEKSKFLSELFDDYGLSLRKSFRMCPSLFYVNKETVEELRKILMYDFSFSQAEIGIILRSCPSLALFSKQKLMELYNFYYPKYFIKRDFKEMITKCPEFFMIFPKEFLNKLSDIKRVFGIADKEACHLITTEPNLLFYSSIEDKLQGFKRLFINKEYIRRNVELLTKPEISIPLKFIISRILGLDSDFDKVCGVDSNLFISRFIFMQQYGNFEHKDLFMSEQGFEEKYHISSRVLLINYRLDMKTVDNISTYYVSLSDTLPNWRDIVFPEFEELIKFYNSWVGSQQLNDDSYMVLREKYGLTFKQYLIRNSLKSLYLQDCEIKFLQNKNGYLINSEKNNILKIVELLKKYGLNLEKILILLLEHPSIFAHSIRDFDIIIKQIVERENCSISQAVYYLV